MILCELDNPIPCHLRRGVPIDTGVSMEAWQMTGIEKVEKVSEHPAWQVWRVHMPDEEAGCYATMTVVTRAPKNESPKMGAFSRAMAKSLA